MTLIAGIGVDIDAAVTRALQEQEESTAVRSRRERRYLAKVNRLMRGIGGYTETQARDALRLLANVRSRVVDDLIALPTTEDNKYRIDTLDHAYRAIDRQAADFAQRYQLLAFRATQYAWNRGLDFAPEALAEVGVEVVPRAEVSREQLQVVQTMLTDLIVKVSSDFRNRAHSVVQLGVLGGRSVHQMMTDMQELLRTQPRRTDAKLGPIAFQAERIIRTETLRAFSLADEVRTRQIAQDVPELKKYWLTAHDGRVRPSHVAAGARYAPGADPGPIDLDQLFVVGGQRMGFPRDPRGSARETIMCRCVKILYKPEWFLTDEERAERERAERAARAPERPAVSSREHEKVGEWVKHQIGEDLREHGLESSWNGTVEEVDTHRYLGMKLFNCGIVLSTDTMHPDARYWHTFTHEMFHSYSREMTESNYLPYRGWEEGVVEKSQRIFLSSHREIGLSLGDLIASWVGNGYNGYIWTLERYRKMLEMDEKSFYYGLLATPLPLRIAKVRAWASQKGKLEQYNGLENTEDVRALGTGEL